MGRRPPFASRRTDPTMAARTRVLCCWYGLMGLGGAAFGLIAERRPFGADVLAHPLVVFFIVAGAGLLLLRIWLARPVPDVIPERTLLFGCFVGVAGFLLGNWIGVRLLTIG
jgi:hypothetical protein